LRAKIVIYVEQEDGKRITAMHEMWFNYPSLATKALKIVMDQIHKAAWGGK